MHICGVDDDDYNLGVIQKDFPCTRHSSEGCFLKLFHLKTPAIDLFPLSGGSAPSSPANPHFCTQYVPSSLPHPDLPPVVIEHHSDNGSSTDYEQFYDGYGSNDERDQ